MSQSNNVIDLLNKNCFIYGKNVEEIKLPEFIAAILWEWSDETGTFEIPNMRSKVQRTMFFLHHFGFFKKFDVISETELDSLEFVNTPVEFVPDKKDTLQHAIAYELFFVLGKARKYGYIDFDRNYTDGLAADVAKIIDNTPYFKRDGIRNIIRTAIQTIHNIPEKKLEDTVRKILLDDTDHINRIIWQDICIWKKYL